MNSTDEYGDLPIALSTDQPTDGTIVAIADGGSIMEYQPFPPHEFAEFFPLRNGKSLELLAENIKKEGLKDEIVLYQGKVLDGRRRQLACAKAGVKPLYREFGSRHSDGFSPLEYCFAVNYHRRDDLTVAEKAMIAAKFATARTGYNRHAKNADGTAPATRKKAAERFGVSVPTIDRARKIITKGTPELQKAVETGTASLKDAADIAGEPPAVQHAAIEAVTNGSAKKLASAVARKPETPPGADPVKIARKIDGLVEEVGLVKTKDKEALEMACEGLKTARALVLRLVKDGPARAR